MAVFSFPRMTRATACRATACRAIALVASFPVALASSLAPALAQQGYGQTLGTSPMEQQMYNYNPSSGSQPGTGSSGLNPANPLDLINKIRKGNALNDATPPGDAVDRALRELESQNGPKPASKPTGPVVASPQFSGGAGAKP